MRRAITVIAAAALAVGVLSTPAQAYEGSESQFESGWDNPTTAVRPITEPSTESCTVNIVDHQFTDDSVHSSDFTPPQDCEGEWSKVVLTLEGSAQGSQAERMGTVAIDGVPIFKTSTPKPSAEGIEWDIEKDVTPYATVFQSSGEVTSHVAPIGDDDPNITGLLALKMSLTFYKTDENNPVPNSADTVTGLGDADLADGAATLTPPRNSHRLVADIYATAEGSDCEQAWYARPSNSTGHACATDDGPYREIQVLLDGEIAGLASPYPNLAADAWDNQYLWSTLPAPGAFNVRPISVDLTPYLGILNDGKKHDVSIRVAGKSVKDYDWSTPTSFRSWQDENSKVVTGGILTSKVSDLVGDREVSSSSGSDSVNLYASREHTVSGWLSTSSGEVMTTIERAVSNSSQHTWRDQDDADSLQSRWRDVETKTVTSDGGNTSTRTIGSTYKLNGTNSVTDGRNTTNVSMSDDTMIEFQNQSGHMNSYTRTHTYEGEASWNRDVPVLERQAKGTSKQRYQLGGEWPCYDRSVETIDGRVTKQRDHCGGVSS